MKSTTPEQEENRARTAFAGACGSKVASLENLENCSLKGFWTQGFYTNAVIKVSIL